jgi:hypothetical protein
LSFFVDIFVSLTNFGNQEVQEHNQHQEKVTKPKEPHDKKGEGLSTCEIISFFVRIIPLAIIRQGNVTNWISENLDKSSNEKWQIIKTVITIAWDFLIHDDCDQSK